MTEAADAREPRGDNSSERDFGDSAGYGGGGSALDHDEVLGKPGARRENVGRNPLDAVVRTGKDQETAEPGSPKQTEKLAGPHAKPALIDTSATPGAGALPSEPTGGDVDPGAG